MWWKHQQTCFFFPKSWRKDFKGIFTKKLKKLCNWILLQKFQRTIYNFKVVKVRCYVKLGQLTETRREIWRLEKIGDSDGWMSATKSYGELMQISFSLKCLMKKWRLKTGFCFVCDAYLNKQELSYWSVSLNSVLAKWNGYIINNRMRRKMDNSIPLKETSVALLKENLLWPGRSLWLCHQNNGLGRNAWSNLFGLSKGFWQSSSLKAIKKNSKPRGVWWNN